ncbi:MAG: hypothetical protein LBI86_11895 [Treponema sp.]|nr:hypothetical protein [Treponema sp.]
MNRRTGDQGARRVCRALLCSLLFAAAPAVFSQDFGLALRQNAFFSDGEKSYGAVEYTGTAVPWFIAPLGEQWDLYVSGGISAFLSDEKWKPLPELYRTEVIFNPNPGFRLRAGRVPFAGSLSYTMTGLFDGVSVQLAPGGGRLLAGIFYTGLLYKKAAYIVMNPEDRADYNDKDVYFASRRLAAGITWEQTGIFETPGDLSASGICQFDLNGGGALVHSQYLEAQFSMPLGMSVNAGLGAALELVERTEKSPYAAFAASAEFRWMLPGALQDMLSASGHFSSGAWNDRAGVFVPLTSQAMGKILRPDFPGIALVEAAYTARLHRSVSADLSGAYYFRTDDTTYSDPGVNILSVSPLLGAEVYGGFNWTPFSDIVLGFGGGAFFPRTGKVFRDDADIKYRVTLEAVISF